MKNKKKIAILTCENYFHHPLTDDEELLVEYLNQEGYQASREIWDKDQVEWKSYDLLVFRSIWDYFEKKDQFLQWLQQRKDEGLLCANPLDAIEWNFNKTYLRQLQQKGAHLLPTVWVGPGDKTTLREILEKMSWKRAVLKPAISANAHETYLFALDEVKQYEEKLEYILRSGPAIIQQFSPEVGTTGEYSFIFLGGKYSHAVLKRPAAGDFRVQEAHGGHSGPILPSPSLIEEAQRVLLMVPWKLAYARVDGIVRDNLLLLMELEIIEPSLFLKDVPDGVARLGRSLVEYLEGSRMT